MLRGGLPVPLAWRYFHALEIGRGLAWRKNQAPAVAGNGTVHRLVVSALPRPARAIGCTLGIMHPLHRPALPRQPVLAPQAGDPDPGELLTGRRPRRQGVRRRRTAARRAAPGHLAGQHDPWEWPTRRP